LGDENSQFFMNKLPHIKDVELSGKRVILRCDLNVPFSSEGKILDDFRIVKSLPTIEYLLQKGAKLIIISHCSADSKEKGAPLPSLKPVAEYLENYLKKDIVFVENFSTQCKEASNPANGYDLVMFENIRTDKGEEDNDPQFAKMLASCGDIYCNDAFGVSHRAHASVSAITQFLPSYAGFLLDKEVSTLQEILDNPKKPMVAIVGGAKLKTKIKVIDNLLKISDHVLLGGNVANVILQAKGMTISGELPQGETLAMAQKVDITNPKVHLPIDAVFKLSQDSSDYARTSPIGTLRKEEVIFDIGPETVRLYSEIISTAKTVFINGPLGLAEDEHFAKGTLGIFKAIKESGAFSVAGGGETNAFLKEHGMLDAISYISTGGGAMLEFVEEVELPGLKALGYYGGN
jgi:3-phosphoglycerate kinase